MTLAQIIKLEKKIYNGCKRTSYIKSQAKKAEFYLIAKGLKDYEIETEKNCFHMLIDTFGSVIYGEV